MPKLLTEFRKFAVKGNAVDLAVGVVIGAAFGKTVTSLVNDVVMPPLGLLVGQLDFSKMGVPLGVGKDGQQVVLRYGAFINNILDFVIVAFAIFVMVRVLDRLKNPPPSSTAEPVARECPQCLSTIPVKAVKCAHCCSELVPK
jgi:large conductance mechanosensitive channel